MFLETVQIERFGSPATMRQPRVPSKVGSVICYSLFGFYTVLNQRVHEANLALYDIKYFFAQNCGQWA